MDSRTHTFSPGSSKFFSCPDEADREGLIRLGGTLSPEWLMDAYSHGVFPWPFTDDFELLAWWSPDPRAVLEFKNLHVSRRLRRVCRSDVFKTTCDRDFVGVIKGCATAQDRCGNTWLSSAMIDAYCEMHALGHAHSVEVWQDDQLVGGIYGIALGGSFSAESMFYHQRDASKVALVRLVRHLANRGYDLLDIQQTTEHTQRMGASELSRPDFLERLAQALTAPVTFGDKLEG